MVKDDSDLTHWLAARTRRDPASGCLVWQGALSGGYAYCLPGGSPMKMIRSVYERVNGPLAAGMAVRQACRNKACCELGHA